MGRIRFGKGGNAVTLSTDLEREIEEALRAMAPRTIGRLEQEADRILAEARKVWPVKTGASRDSLAVSIRATDGVARVGIYSTDDGAYKIRSSKVGTEEDAVRTRSPWQDLVRKPVRASTKKVAEDLAEIVADDIQGAFNGRK